MGPDEFHDGYPGQPGSGVRDNAYTNILTAWLLYRTIDLLQVLDGYDCGRLRDRLHVSADETARWNQISRRLMVPFHADGIISQFDGYEQLAEFEADAYRTRYANIGRLDLILATEGDSPNNYRLSKQADVLMLFYLLSAEELRNILDRLGYPLTPGTIRATVDFYTARTSHGSTLSRVVHAWVNARADRHQAWTLFSKHYKPTWPTPKAARPGKASTLARWRAPSTSSCAASPAWKPGTTCCGYTPSCHQSCLEPNSASFTKGSR
jgi:trehalose/maltose hydrolase-like predicted phosphorylase